MILSVSGTFDTDNDRYSMDSGMGADGKLMSTEEGRLSPFLLSVSFDRPLL
jgi:hypothetical protein